MLALRVKGSEQMVRGERQMVAAQKKKARALAASRAVVMARDQMSLRDPTLLR